MRLAEIKKRYGERGIEDLVLNTDGKVEVTDDTQLILFTAEGLPRALTQRRLCGDSQIPTAVYRAYFRWLHTQGVKCRGREDVSESRDSWLLGVKALYARRAPGSTCLSALSSGSMGTIEKPINNSKGCGGVIRVAPVGLLVGNILGACLGAEGILPEWWERVELKDEIIAVADDLLTGFEESKRDLKDLSTPRCSAPGFF